MWVTIFRDDDDADLLWKRSGSGSRIMRTRKDNSGRWGTDPAGSGRNSISTRDRRCRATIGQTARRSRRRDLNLVFMQFIGCGGSASLPSQHRTGMGLETAGGVAQGVYSNYDSDVVRPLLNAWPQGRGSVWGEDTTIGRCAWCGPSSRDHVLMADGVLPSNEARLCAAPILRRARAMDGAGASATLLHELTAGSLNQMAGLFRNPGAAATIARRRRRRERSSPARSRLADSQ